MYCMYYSNNTKGPRKRGGITEGEGDFKLIIAKVCNNVSI